MVAGKRILSGIQPSGIVHLGNYLGALRNWVAFQERPETQCLYCAVDLHAITVAQDAEVLRKNILNTAALCLAVGIDPKRSVLFVQSDVPEHAELGWIMNCHVYFGELSRMTQFKDKSQKQEAATTAGLFTYPALMAGDILLYDASQVPVGEDQTQHLELARDLARRFNNAYGKPELFRVPEAIIPESGGRIMGLDDAAQKMSKSASSEANYIALDDSPEAVRKKFKTAQTDSGREVVFDAEKKPAISNLMTIYSLTAGIPVAEVQSRFAGKGYGDFKKDLAETVVTFLAPIQERLRAAQAKPDDLRDVLADGAKRARELAKPKLDEVKARLGLGSQKLYTLRK
jgi:tryptophanyl-tRNA synthetase